MVFDTITEYFLSIIVSTCS